jgi:hypothetical protein
MHGSLSNWHLPCDRTAVHYCAELISIPTQLILIPRRLILTRCLLISIPARAASAFRPRPPRFPNGNRDYSR